MSDPGSAKLILPSIRARIGDWWYYVTTMTFREVADWVKPVDEIHERAELKTWIQREIRPERRKAIAEYLCRQEQRFFNAIVVGVYGGNPDWLPVVIGRNPAAVTEPSERVRESIGIITLEEGAEIFAVDGQHRVEGIKEALQLDAALGSEEVCAIFVAHAKTDIGRKRTRRLFFTLNRYAKPVSDGELVALSEDDTYAIVTRRLIDEHPHLNAALVPLTPKENLPPGNDVCFTSVLALNQMIRTVVRPTSAAERRLFEIGPPNPSKVNEVFAKSGAFIDSLRKHFQPVAKVTAGKPTDHAAAQYRNAKGGHLLLRPVGQLAFAKAVAVLQERGKSADQAVRMLSTIEMEFSRSPWTGILWNAVAGTVINKHKTIATELMLWLVGEQPKQGKQRLLERYRKALDDSSVTLPER